MKTPPPVFNESVDRWIKENDLPWMKLKTETGLSNLKRRLSGESLRILDAGGGSGYDAIPLAREGHHVLPVDYSTEMAESRP